ncbi:hypothetical protein F5X98DRAFT_99914 [Xylaria grammica]|nr:hypothetical protein F5X98DRAFT_99914 [Xylaria grammica]
MMRTAHVLFLIIAVESIKIEGDSLLVVGVPGTGYHEHLSCKEPRLTQPVVSTTEYHIYVRRHDRKSLIMGLNGNEVTRHETHSICSLLERAFRYDIQDYKSKA